MAEFNFHGLDEIMLNIAEIASIPEEVQDEMITAQAQVTMEAQREEAKKLGMYSGYDRWNNLRDWANNQLPGQERSYSTGQLAKSIRIGKPKTKKGVRKLSIYFAGSRTRGGKRRWSAPKKIKNSEIAFLNEYGTRTINARHFIWIANEKSANKATEAALEVYDRWLKSKDL